MLAKELNKFIYFNGIEDIIQQGRKIYGTGQVYFVSEDKTIRAITFRVKDNVYNIFYNVHIKNYHDTKAIFLRCNCIHQKRYLCKHKVAALFFLKNLIEKKLLSIQEVHYDQSHTIIKMGHIDMKEIKSLTSPHIVAEATKLIRVHKAKIEPKGEGGITAALKDNKENFNVHLCLTPDKEFITSCPCSEKQFILCKHKVAIFFQILYGSGPHYFSTLRNMEEEKKLTSKRFSEKIPDELPQDINPNRQTHTAVLQNKPLTTPSKTSLLSSEDIKALRSQIENVRVPSIIEKIIFKENIQSYPHFTISVSTKESSYNIHDSTLWKKIKNNTEKELIKGLQKLTHPEIINHLAGKKYLFYTSVSEETVYKDFQSIPEDIRPLYFSYLTTKFKVLNTLSFEKKHLTFQAINQKTSDKLNPITFASTPIEPVFFIDLTQENRITITAKMQINDTWVALNDNQFMHNAAFLYQHTLYVWKENYYDIFLSLQEFTAKPVYHTNWQDFANKKLQNIFQYHRFEIHKKLAKITTVPIQKTEIKVQETEHHLMLDLFFTYENTKIEYSEHKYLYTQEKNNILLIERDKTTEEKAYTLLDSLYKHWIKTEINTYPYRKIITKGDALKQRWFLQFLESMKAEGIAVVGLEQLKKFSLQEVRPIVKLDIKSGIDWLDVKMKVQLENETVPLEQLKKMFRANNYLLTLQSGKMVSLSKNWIKKYKLLFDLAEKKEKEKLLFHKSQANLLKAITEKEEDQQKYLYINWSKEAEELLNHTINTSLRPPKNLQTIIRNYQKDSFHWFQHLKKLGYNGLLGDDMGLGKTLQVLTNLSYEKQTHKKLSTLIICPTSLIYTWQEEIKKFTPNLKFFVYHNTKRTADLNYLKNYDIIITTYGIMRTDIAFFKRHVFDYIILDESQYIKNPNSKVYQAVISLQSKHKICLSGTPIQNNTFDLYAQINFLNPNFLGPLSFFKNHFSLPIDRYDDKEIKQVLKNAISPLFLRRTKKEVSPELPDKEVNILYCDMSEKQRKIYDAYRDEFRSSLLGIVQKEGIQTHKMHILQALTKLRMICNAPSILKEETQYPNVSIKRDLLIEQIEANIAEHKIIVFSQFLGMLDLIRQSLKKTKIPFEYLDGSTSSKEREKAVKRFQDESSCKVFLISLKAGGVGLNLTAADYVYIVDPWWNPTIEIQAIDRTHRIGQTKKIFAQRMICKNTIEEKIIALQEKKFKLSKAIIEKTDDSFLKEITQEDLDYLLG